MKKIFIVLLGGLVLIAPALTEAYIGLCCSHCGGNMPLNLPGGGIPEPNEWRIKVNGSYMNMNGLREGTSDREASKELDQPLKMSMGMSTMNMSKYMAVPTDMRMGMSNLSAGYSFSDDWAAMIMFMFADKRMDMKFGDMMQRSTGQNDFTMRSAGMADTMLTVKYRLYADDEFAPTGQASLLFGVSLPTGSINQTFDTHPDDSQDDNPLPYGMQLGSGTFDPVIGLLYQASAAPLPIWWGVAARYTGRWYDNFREYRLGDQFKFDIYGMYQVRYDLLFQVQLNGEYKGKITGELDESKENGVGHYLGNPDNPFTTPLYDPENYGGQKIGFTAGVQWQPVPRHILDLSFSMPFHQDLNGLQLKEDFRGLSCLASSEKGYLSRVEALFETDAGSHETSGDDPAYRKRRKDHSGLS